MKFYELYAVNSGVDGYDFDTMWFFSKKGKFNTLTTKLKKLKSDLLNKLRKYYSDECIKFEKVNHLRSQGRVVYCIYTYEKWSNRFEYRYAIVRREFK